MCIYVFMYINVSDLEKASTPQLFYTCFYSHAHRLRLEKPLLTVSLPKRSLRFRSETVI